MSRTIQYPNDDLFNDTGMVIAVTQSVGGGPSSFEEGKNGIFWDQPIKGIYIFPGDGTKSYYYQAGNDGSEYVDISNINGSASITVVSSPGLGCGVYPVVTWDNGSRDYKTYIENIG